MWVHNKSDLRISAEGKNVEIIRNKLVETSRNDNIVHSPFKHMFVQIAVMYYFKYVLKENTIHPKKTEGSKKFILTYKIEYIIELSELKKRQGGGRVIKW